jgi:hypothetical protein
MKEKLAQQNIEQWQKKADGHAIDVERLSDAWSEKSHYAFCFQAAHLIQ